MFLSSLSVAAPSRSVVAYGSKTPRENRESKHHRIRNKVNGVEERPRLNVFRSNHHIYCQVIDDVQGHTIASASTQSKNVRESLGEDSAATVAAATLVGKAVAETCKEKGIVKVVFDRAGYKYHGRVRAVADAAREGGLDF